MTADRFQVVLNHPAGYVHAGALAEAAQYIDAQIRLAGYPCELAVNRLGPGCVNVIVGAHLLSEAGMAGLPPDSVIFNSEPLEDQAAWHLEDGSYSGLLARLRVWDYSPRNLPLIPHARKDAIPFLFCRRLVPAAFTWQPDAHLLFYGAMTPHRQTLLDALAAAGVAVRHIFGVYGPARDAELARCLAVLNLHQRAEQKLFEPLRCAHPLTLGVPVITEPSPEDACFGDVAESVFAVPTADFAAGVAALLRDREAFLRAARGRLARFRRTDPQPALRKAIRRALRQRG